MAYVVTSSDTVSASGYIPSSPGISATGFVTISSKKVVLKGDIVDSHTDPGPPTTHSGATMTNTSNQTFFKISSKEVILINDSATCSSSHKVTSTFETFVNVSF